MINRNGGEYLRGALKSLRAAMAHAWNIFQEVELILVDNGSTDSSIAIMQEAMSGAQWEWRILEEKTPGCNSARNAGLRDSHGSHVIFTDNDLTFDVNWLVGYYNAIRAFPQQRVFAGRVKVGNIEGAIPSWLDIDGDYSRPCIVVRCDNGESEIVADLNDETLAGPVGPNMAFARSIFDDYGAFNIEFGLRPGSLVPGAEAELFHRFGKHRESFVYVPQACVFHPLKKNQICQTYFRRRLSGVGQVLARMQRLDGIKAKRIFGIKRYLFRQLATAYLRYLATWFQQSDRKRFFHRCNISMLWGQMKEDYQYYCRTQSGNVQNKSTIQSTPIT